MPVRDPSKAELPFNRFVLAGPDGVAAVYDKIHPFSYGGEHEHYAAGAERLTVTVEGVRITPFVCYDLRFSDEFWTLAHDTDCYVVVANWPAPRRAHWSALLVARAIENQAFVVGVNRVGTGGRHRLSGRLGGDRPVRGRGGRGARGRGGRVCMPTSTSPGWNRSGPVIRFLKDRR